VQTQRAKPQARASGVKRPRTLAIEVEEEDEDDADANQAGSPLRIAMDNAPSTSTTDTPVLFYGREREWCGMWGRGEWVGGGGEWGGFMNKYIYVHSLFSSKTPRDPYHDNF